MQDQVCYSSFSDDGCLPLSVQRTNPYDTDISTADTIVQMSKYARTYCHDPLVIGATQDALQYGYSDQRDIATAIFYWIRTHIAFVEDEELMYNELGIPYQDLDKELLITPPVLLSMRYPMGDCDDFSILGASMLLACGIQPYFITVAAAADEPSKFSHVYVCAYLSDEDTLVCMDAGNRFENIPVGWEPQNIYRKAVFPV